MNQTFIKVMMMTTSDNDAEALAALRKANKMLRDAKLNWQQLLDGASHRDQSYRVPPSRRPHHEPEWGNVNARGVRYDDAYEINGMFEKALAKNTSEGFGEFLSSIHVWWEERGWLSEKQYNALKRAAEKV